MAEIIEYIIPEHDDGIRVGSLLKSRLHLSMGLLRKLKRTDGGITLDGSHATVRETARCGQRLRILAEADESAGGSVVPVAGPLDIAFEDAHILILNKPAGLPVHPSRGHYTNTLANRVVSHLGGDAAFRAVNRLDRGTSGLVCIAKSAYSAQRLGRSMACGGVARRYLAVCRGVGLPESGTIDRPIGRVPGMGIMRHVTPEGDRAVTHFRRLAQGEGCTLLEIRLETGRTHQIRVHLSSLGHPVVGDFMYGDPLTWLDGHALHAHFLAVQHPVTGQRLEFEAPAPPYFKELIGERE